jgi:predicted CoA-binding protein
MNFEYIFDNYKNIAVYGMSEHPVKAAHSVPAYMNNHGFNIIPINPRAEVILGKPVYRSIANITEEIDILNVFRPSHELVKIVEEAIGRRKQRGDIKLIWVQEGLKNDDARLLAKENNIEYIQNVCMYKEFVLI